jgi:hypothetical protein
VSFVLYDHQKEMLRLLTGLDITAYLVYDNRIPTRKV